MPGDEPGDVGLIPEFSGEEDPIPLADEWSGLKQNLPPHLKLRRLVRCERILVRGEVRECEFHAPDVCLANPVDTDEPYDPSDGDPRGLRLVAKELKLGLNDQQIEAILQRKTPQEIEDRRAAIRGRYDGCRTSPGGGNRTTVASRPS